LQEEVNGWSYTTQAAGGSTRRPSKISRAERAALAVLVSLWLGWKPLPSAMQFAFATNGQKQNRRSKKEMDCLREIVIRNLSHRFLILQKFVYNASVSVYVKQPTQDF
jgi:hypothetical protein